MRGDGAYIRGESLCSEQKKKRFKTSYSTFDFTRILKLQNVVEIPIFISMQARSRVLSRIYCLEERCRVAEGHVPKAIFTGR